MHMTLTIISLALIPVAVLVVLLVFADRHNKEPAKLLAKVFIFGILASIPVLIIQVILNTFSAATGIWAIIFQAFIVAGLTEEYMKRMVVLKIAFRNPAFDERLDGIIYCAFAALGFAAIENVLYLISYYPTQPSVAIYRAVLSVPAHMLFGITMGYYLSLSKYCSNPVLSRKYFQRSLIYPVLLHGTFNFLLSINIPLLLVFVPFIIFMWIYNLKKLNKFYKESKNMIQ
ncbi:MAG: PrsW family intramembrane metalloprotease [Clostridia bacterium]|nr:PrsW family intramembrane metalloprotease [Clostridia bacterium]MBN2883232.1 PrsW family intramembrane metalloprotease [Clostridia bacterium]